MCTVHIFEGFFCIFFSFFSSEEILIRNFFSPEMIRLQFCEIKGIQNFIWHRPKSGGQGGWVMGDQFSPPSAHQPRGLCIHTSNSPVEQPQVLTKYWDMIVGWQLNI